MRQLFGYVDINQNTFTTPFFGIPIGVIAYFLFFYKDDDFDEMAERYDYQDKNKK